MADAKGAGYLDYKAMVQKRRRYRRTANNGQRLRVDAECRERREAYEAQIEAILATDDYDPELAALLRDREGQ